MNYLNYNGDLKDDIENSKKPFNGKREFVSRVISFIIGIPVYCLGETLFGFDRESLKNNILYYSSCYVVLETAIQCYVFKRNKKKTDERYENSNQRLYSVITNMNLFLNNPVEVSKEDLQRAVIFEDSEKVTDVVNDVKKSTETITNTFYFLDKKDKIQVLKSIRKILKDGRKTTSDTTSLYYTPEEMDALNLPVKRVKKLEPRQ